MTGHRVLIAPSFQIGLQYVRENPDLADVRVVTPRGSASAYGLPVSEILVYEGAAWEPGFDELYAVLEHSRRKTVGRVG